MTTQTSQPSQRLLWASVAASALLAVTGGVAFYYASLKSAGRGEAFDAVMTVAADGCQPAELSVPGGNRRFEIVNQSDRPIEWEILDGVMVVAERENIAPGFRQVLTAQLRPGDYEMACGLLSNARGVLHVLPSDEATAAASEVTVRRLLGPLSEYRVSSILAAGKAVTAGKGLRDAIAAGDIAGARTAWRAARLAYRQVEPLAYKISDIENRIDPLPTYLDQREEDPGFVGYHRLEYGLFDRNSMDGLLPVADQLVGDLEALQARLKELSVGPDLLMAAPADMTRLLAETQIPAGENGYAHTDLEEFAASAETIGKLVGLFDPILVDVAPELGTKLDADLAAIDVALSEFGAPGTFPDYETVAADRRQALAAHFATLAADLDTLPTVLGEP